MKDRPRRRDWIEVRGVRVMGIHGVLPEERVRAQPFEVDLDLFVDLRAAAATDELEATVDYSAAIDVATALVGGGRSYELLEALAEALAKTILALDARLEAVRVSLRKLEPPVRQAVTSVGVSVTRRRADGE